MPTAVSMQAESQVGYADRSSSPPLSPGSFATAADSPLIRRDVDPYASPPVTSVSDGLSNPAQYATPGWCLFGISIANLGYDVVWTAIITLGLLVDNAGADADAVLGSVLFFLWALLSIVIHSATLVAGLRMTQQRSLATARLGSILGLIPCGICSVIQIPLAIWAIVVLYNPNAARDFSD